VTDAFAGITRKRAGTGWAYYAPNGTSIRDHDKRRRLNKLAIPPAWTDVWICPDQAATSRRRRARPQAVFTTRLAPIRPLRGAQAEPS